MTLLSGPVEVADDGRPLLLGYVLKHLLMTDDEVTATKKRLERFAALEGFDLRTVYVEDSATSPAAFEALVAAIIRQNVTAVVTPGLLHLAALAPAHDIKNLFERATGARIVIAGPS